MLSANLPGGAAFIMDREGRCLLAGGEALESLGDQLRKILLAGQWRTRSQNWHSLHAVLPPTAARRALPISEHMIRGRTFLSRGVPLRDAASTVYAVVTVSYDITERKHAEHALQKSEETLRLMMESAHEYAIFTTDLEHAGDNLEFGRGAPARLCRARNRWPIRERDFYARGPRGLSS